jgi:hypothetical protein
MRSSLYNYESFLVTLFSSHRCIIDRQNRDCRRPRIHCLSTLAGRVHGALHDLSRAEASLY